MGRSSRFLFPLPGRKKPAIGPKTSNVDSDRAHIHLSKAQRILGVGEGLNVDHLNTDGESLSSNTRPPSSGLSVTLSEVSTPDDELYNTRSWDVDSEMYPSRELRGKASSTLLGLCDIDETGLRSRSLHKEYSNSTIRSQYDRQQVPLAVSQQTSASSTRDLALRKGLPPVVLSQSSPRAVAKSSNAGAGSQSNMGLLQHSRPTADCDTSKRQNRSAILSVFEDSAQASAGIERSVSTLTADISGIHCHSDIRQNTRDELSTNADHDRMRQQHRSGQARTRRSFMNETHGGMGVLVSDDVDGSFAGIETIVFPSPQNSHTSSARPRTIPIASHRRDQSSFDFVRLIKSSIRSVPLDRRSTTSSKRTARSVFSDSDLRNDSVLSLSSDESSEEDLSSSTDAGCTQPSHLMANSQIADRSIGPCSFTALAYKQNRHSRDIRQLPQGSSAKSPLAVSFPAPDSTRVSGPWRPGQLENDTSSLSIPKPSIDAQSSMGAARDWRPRFSPSSAPIQGHRMEIEDSRTMTVTKQEEALLEALRDKRAHMHDNYVSDERGFQDIARYSTPTQHAYVIPSRYDYSNHVEKEQIRLYLKQPSNEVKSTAITEPSNISVTAYPGKDNIISRASPISQWSEQAGSTSSADLVLSDVQVPCVPRSAARLSAVGSMEGFSHGHRGLQTDTPNIDG